MKVRIDQTISQAKNFGVWLHKKTNGKNLPSKETNVAGVCLLQHSLDVADATIILLEHDLQGPAWTLARPLLESFVRGIWILQCASDEQVENFRNGKCPLFPELLKAMADHDEAKLHADWVRAQTKNKDIFHDFTHGGIEHAMRRITKKDEETVVEPNYQEHELEYLVGLGTEVRIRVGHKLFSLMKDSEAIKQLCEEASVFPRLAIKY